MLDNGVSRENETMLKEAERVDMDWKKVGFKQGNRKEQTGRKPVPLSFLAGGENILSSR